ncbi:hypothetical protein C2S53_011185 [Perilla frutescens var. hirtella]|uniref:Receptor-like serine/threonine-protein kinase n=1 Tax=Perilla frutescens var. hirtella TaxID=608512 RepID=A0AAD4IMQ9_PERFH|nr:hypothetical protein C2S53_011185 [Perilla frutescens var. hirtella]
MYEGQVVWSANQNNLVGENATLELTDGDLVLRDADGSLVWSTDTSGKAIAGLNLTEMGNLVMFDANSSVVWQSFDYPTDCLLPGQILASGKNLTAGLFSLSVTEQGLVASVLSDPPQVYYPKFFFPGSNTSREASSARFINGSLDVYTTGVNSLNTSISIPPIVTVQYMQFGQDGHLRVFEVDGGNYWREVADVFNIDKCYYPMVCGRLGICSNGQCSCPRSSSNAASIRPVNERDLELGCSEVIPLSCNASDNHSFLNFKDISYFSFISHITDTNISSCEEACLKNCSCKASIMRYSVSRSDCSLLSEIFSLMNDDGQNYYNYSVSIKIQLTDQEPKKTSLLRPILGSSLGFFCVATVIGTTTFVLWRRRKFEEVEEEFLDHVPGMPTRFSLEELVIATKNFSTKLGEGGFGSVFEGLLNDGTRVAVKRLDGVSHIKKSFLAEVESIGSIHHINLVRLIGFCAEKTHRLLIYEYMCNGSLDSWIYHRSCDESLNWNIRRKIILDIAKGLAYLHEGCRQKIIHLDIKPQNILLDEHFNAKLADFGFSKLIDRNQSRVVTTMRGTPGYLAPEWLGAVITEKVDVYSFGVVVLEILCGRKLFEQSRQEEERYLLPLFKEKAEKGEWLDLVDKCCQDVEANATEVEEKMQISAWCMQSDHEKRPRISMVIKVLEGVKDVQKDINYDLIMPQCLISKTPESSSKDATHLLPSLLSGPR